MHKSIRMKILLIGEYSRLHLTLAEGLRKLGHTVTVASDGDGFKNYSRDIDISRRSSAISDTAISLVKTAQAFRQFKGYDIVQINNPCFTPQNVIVNKQLYKYLRKHNPKVFLGAFGEDAIWMRASLNKNLFRYSEFQIDNKPINSRILESMERKWLNNKTEQFNRYIADTADGIIACLYEYYTAYKNDYQAKSVYIPLPINTDRLSYKPLNNTPQKISFFIGINKDRSQFKGTDILEKALIRLKEHYPNEIVIKRAESISYDTYNEMMEEAHVVLDQLYSYTPAMNALAAMASGKIVISGGEPEMYELLGEKQNHPIINVYPIEDDVFNKLEHLINHKHLLPHLSASSRLFIEKHHSYTEIAKQYLSFWCNTKS